MLIFKIAVLSPAKDKLHPPLLKIGFGNSYLFGSPFSAKTSIIGPPGNSIPKSFAVLSNASPNASSIVVPNLLYFPNSEHLSIVNVLLKLIIKGMDN